MRTRTLRTVLLSLFAMLISGTALAGEKDFAVILNNEAGTMLTDDEVATNASVSFGVAVASDGTVSRVAADDAQAVAIISGTYHSNHGLTGMVAKVKVDGPSKIMVGNCQYGSPASVKDENGETLFTLEQATNCYHQDHSQNFTTGNYLGQAATLTIQDGGYVPYLAVRAMTAEEIEAASANFTLTYYNIDGSVIGTQEVKGQDPIGQFAFGAADVTVPEGKVFRGWFVSTQGGKKFQVSDKVEKDLDLFAVATDKEVADNNSSYSYVLSDQYFDPADHECIEMTGKAYWHDSQHGWAFQNGDQIILLVGGDATISMGLCQYSGGNTATVTDAEGNTVTTFTDKVDTDGTTVTLEYTGAATTLTITFAGVAYIHSVSIANHSKNIPQDVVAKWSWQEGIPASISSVHVEGTTGTVASDVEGIELFVDATNGKLKSNGDNVQFNAGTILRVPVKTKGDVVTVVAHPYNFQDIQIAGTIYTTQSTEYEATASDAADGYVEIVSTHSPYLYSIQVVLKADKGLASLDNEPVKAIFPFNLGTADQTANFGDTESYFLSSKVTLGSNLSFFDANSGMTRIAPETQEKSAGETNAICFTIQPKFGLTFTPTRVALKSTRFGTDNGLLDFAWLNPDKTTVTLATGEKPNRNNASPAYSEYAFNVENATPAEGPCGLIVYLYNLQNGKQIGFSDVVIEGTLSGQEKEVPVLASFTANGIVYVADKVFEPSGDNYVANIELSKKETMVSENNPVTDISALSGTVGQVTYEGDETHCNVNIPVTLGEITINYIACFVQKPDFTLTYIDTDKKTVLGTQLVEKDAAIGNFDIDFTTATAPEGQKVRGWFHKTIGDIKYTTDDVVTSDLNLYAVATEIETVSNFKKYIFDLTNKYFYHEDHEAFNPTGSFYWHDNQHGWAFHNGDQIDLLVGPQATVSVTLCQYGSGQAIVVKDADGQTLGSLEAKAETDGGVVAFIYEGAGGKLSLCLESGGEMYIHGVKIANTAETNYEKDGQWYFVKAGDAGSLLDVLDVVNGANASKTAERSFIFVPDGVYDLGETANTQLYGNNVSIIGQSIDKTIIKNAPDKSVEGLGSTATLLNTGDNNYFQDLTLQNALDYYGALGAGQVGGRATALWDKGNRTVQKNVRLLSYQDTYFSNNNDAQVYWETSDIHGTVDFICGGGDIRFQNCTLGLEPRTANGTGGRTIVAPTTTTNFGYVFDGCKVVDLAEGKGNWNFGRTWQNEPICVYLNTTLDANAQNTLVSSRWTEKGMNNKDPKRFGEYNTMDLQGNNITPESNTINSHGGKFQTIMTAEDAAYFSYDNMFTNWNPAELTKQAQLAAANYDNGTITWTADGDALTYAVFKNGQLVGLTDGLSFNITIDPTQDELAIRAANQMGGLGLPVHVNGTTTGIQTATQGTQSSTVFNLQGQRVKQAVRGLYIVDGRKVIR